MGVSLRVLSYNIHKGFSASNRRFVLDQIKEAIRLANADIVFLQEVVGEHSGHAEEIEGWPASSQFEYLADEMWPHFAYGKNAVYTHGHHGNAILSRFPISSWENIDISTNLFEQRGVLHATIDLLPEPLKLHCLCLHLNLLRGSRRTQLDQICSRVEAAIPEGEAFLIAGDFNDWSGYATEHLVTNLKAGEVFHAKNGACARTFPAWLPILRLDRIYYRGLRVNEAKVLRGKPWNRLSDHAALFAAFENE